MALFIVATPIGNSQDISVRALDCLKKAETIILEEFKESTTFLRSQGISGKKYEQLNEHSTPADIQRLAELCASQDIPLITDCGTPGFCDPGADLVRICRKNKIPVKTLPGPSSLMAILSLSSVRLDQFLFRGFISNETEARKKDWQELVREKRAFLIMDTPYRFQKTLQEIKEYIPKRKCLLAINITAEDEIIIEDSAEKIATAQLPNKAEFILLVYPDAQASH
jgi:16S rRNA (cytidine1402-2'-O)-methyltransferase